MEKVKLEIKKSYRVGNVEYETQDQAYSALAREILEKHLSDGIESVIENSSEVIRALKIISAKRK